MNGKIAIGALLVTLTLGTLSGCNGPDVTQAEFDQVHMNMSYADVVKTFGSDPDESSDIGLGAKSCTWKNEDDTFVFIIFAGDQVKDFKFVDPMKMLGNQ
ncbi:hypothetical protein EON80_07920 [bacterium]|nr:MAG: hypothetical protein EON80_07920 [bacterium]